MISAGPRKTATCAGNLHLLVEVPRTTSMCVDVAVTFLSTALLWRVPGLEALLQDDDTGFGCFRPVDDRSTHCPELVLEIGLTTGQDLIRVTNRRFALTAPGQELLCQRIIHRHLVIRQAEESRQ